MVHSNTPNEEKAAAEKQDTVSTDQIDTQKIKQADQIDFSFKPIKFNLDLQKEAPAQSNPENQEILEEMADDMLHLIEASSKMENRILHMQETLVQITQNQANFHKEQMVEKGKLKKELISERKALIARSTFNAVLPTIESLEINCNALDTNTDKDMIQQMKVASGMLVNIIQSLGYYAFESSSGEPFGPAIMECIGYENGDAGKVVRIERKGYRTEGALIKPCGVILGKAE